MSAAFDPKTAPPSVFPAHDAVAYEQVMGRWSHRLAPLLIEFGGLAEGDRVLEVGCGTGNLSFTLPEAADVSAVTGIDRAEVFLEAAQAQQRPALRLSIRAGTTVRRWLVRPRLFDARAVIHSRYRACCR